MIKNPKDNTRMLRPKSNQKSDHCSMHQKLEPQIYAFEQFSGHLLRTLKFKLWVTKMLPFQTTFKPSSNTCFCFWRQWNGTCGDFNPFSTGHCGDPWQFSSVLSLRLFPVSQDQTLTFISIRRRNVVLKFQDQTMTRLAPRKWVLGYPGSTFLPVTTIDIN